MTTPRPIVIVDDSEDDIWLIRRRLCKAGISQPILTFSSGDAFLEYVSQIERGEEVMPALVLLDINLPGMSGHETLREMRGRPGLREEPPVLVISHSRAASDVEEAQTSGAGSYLVKPSSQVEWQAFFAAVRAQLAA